jgi:lysozyme
MSDHPSCIDISHWQDFPDFDQVRAAGVVAMIHKATEGTGYIDPNRTTNITNAVRAGIACCTYHWLSPGVSAAAQMEFYLDVVDPVEGERMVIDYEEQGCTLDELKEAVRALKADPRGLQVTVYSGHLLKEQLGNDRDDYLAENTDLWLAQYTDGQPSWPDETYDNWTLWQYSETGQVDGIYGSEVDLNQFDGPDDELIEWISPEGAAPPRPQPPPGDTVFVNVIAPDNIKIQVHVSGARVLGEARRGPDIKRRR